MSKDDFEDFFEPPTRAGVIDLAEAGFICKQINQENTIKYLENQIAVLERALEFACKEVLEGWCSDYCGTGKNCNNCHYKKVSLPEYFKSTAEQEIKKEKE